MRAAARLFNLPVIRKALIQAAGLHSCAREMACLFQMLLAENDTLVFLRDSEAQQIVVVAQRGPARRAAAPIPVAHGGLPDGLELQELFSARRATVIGGCLDLGALEPGAQVWVSIP